MEFYRKLELLYWRIRTFPFILNIMGRIATNRLRILMALTLLIIIFLCMGGISKRHCSSSLCCREVRRFRRGISKPYDPKLVKRADPKLSIKV
jgi:hypothetical protein